MDSGAQALGCTVIAAGSDDAIAVADVMGALEPRAFVGSPEFLKRLIGVAGGSHGAATIRHALVAGAPLTRRAAPAISRRPASRCRSAWCIPTSASSPMRAMRSTGMIVNEGLIVEIVRPGIRRAGRRRRGRRGRRHRVQSRLSDDPPRHRPSRRRDARPLALWANEYAHPGRARDGVVSLRVSRA